LTVDPSLWTTLLKGTRAWNEMRTSIGESSQIDLSRLNFSAASNSTIVEDPYDYYFDGLNCAGITLTEAILDDGSFNGASFAKADLSYASIARASLRRADLRGASLIGTLFRAADLRDADFSGAELGDSAFLRIDLSEFRGLGSTRHRFRSIIDVASLELTVEGLRSHKKQTRDELLRQTVTFLINCGIPVAYVSLFQSLVTRGDTASETLR